MAKILINFIIEEGGAEFVNGIVVDSPNVNKAGLKKEEQQYPTISMLLCMCHIISLRFKDIFKLPKLKRLFNLSNKLGITVSDAMAVGDGANDLGMLTRAGTGVALHAKPSVQKECDVRINHGDLTALLFIQGYARTDFAS